MSDVRLLWLVVICCRMAIQINPMFADGYSNMGNVYKDMGRFEEASQLYLRAIGTRVCVRVTVRLSFGCMVLWKWVVH